MKRGKNSGNASIGTSTYGIFRAASGKQFVLEADDHRIITYRMSAQTTVENNGKDADIAKFTPGDHLIVDSTEDDNGFFTATAVKFEKPATPEDRAHAGQTWDLPRLDGRGASASASAPQREPGDDRPVLRRKKDDDSKSADAPAPQSAKSEPSKEPEEPIDTRPSTEMRPPDPPRDSDDSGPPVLRHGAPPRRAASVDSSAAPESVAGPIVRDQPKPTPVPAAAPPSVVEFQDDPVIAKAREVAAQFSGSLPNFFCLQVTTRYQSDHPKSGWDPIDVISADVAYENGEESYKNIKVGNKPVNKDMMDIGGGATSTGEFESILLALLEPQSGARFHRTGTDTIHGRSTYVFSFEIPRERSTWRIETTSQLYYPAYGGSVWIDKETSRVLRLEEQARSLPLLFPLDTVESAVEYDFIRLSTPQQFLLPVNAEVLNCIRGSRMCARNRIEFRNYRKFGATSDITFDGKDGK